jgi:hypothetical protein
VTVRDVAVVAFFLAAFLFYGQVDNGDRGTRPQAPAHHR